MTQTNEWGVDDAPETEWGDPSSDVNAWGDDNASGDTQWGDAPVEAPTQEWGVTSDQPTQAWDAPVDDTPTWGDGTEDTPVVTSPTQAWGDLDPGIDPSVQDDRSSFTWSGDEQDESPLGRFETADPQRERKLSTKTMLIIGAVALVVVLIAVGIFSAVRATGGEDPDTPPPSESSQAANPELAQFDPFAKDLQEALNNRDAKAYHALLSSETQKQMTVEDTQAAVEALTPGAQYEVVLVDGSAAGPTATVKLTLVRTLAGSTTEQAMTAQLHKEGEDWKMVVDTNDQ